MAFECTREELLKALKAFDDEKRKTSEWLGWERNPRFKWAIEHDGKRYPVKETLRMAIGKSPTGGKPSNRLVERVGFEVNRIGETDQMNNFWIFQANPAHFDLPSAMKKLKEIAFSANQKSDSMNIGDTVFFWESGANGGLLGSGSLETQPKMMANPKGEIPFLKSDKLPDETLKVIVKVEKILPKPITKNELKDHPILKVMPFFKMAQGTNFLLRKAEGYSFQAAMDGHLNPGIFKVIPGKGKKFWKDCLKDEIICAGWKDIQSISSYKTKEDYRKYYDSIYSHGTKNKQELQANMLWTFRNLAPGDIIVSSSGGKELLAVGIVQNSGYKFRNERPEYKHTIPVKWDISYKRTFEDSPFTRLTINKLDLAKFHRLIGAEGVTPPPPVGDFGDLMKSISEAGFYFSDEVVANYILALQTKRFVIFTGISGTGKTQLALLLAGFINNANQNANNGFECKSTSKLAAHSVSYTTHPSFYKNGLQIKKSDISEKLIKFIANNWPNEIYEERNPPKIKIHYPDGITQQTAYIAPQDKYFEIRFSAKFKKWLENKIKLGDTFLIEFLEPVSKDEQLSVRFIFNDNKQSVHRIERNKNILIIPVRPDWTDNRGLLGYYNPITKQYMDTPLIEFIQRAHENPEHAFFLILDEMNLARVEYYFSDFLSCLESDAPIHLHDDPAIEEGEDKEGKAIPCDLKIPDNLFITGTVNVDETTYMFSPKVLDRAFTIELSEVDFEAATGGAIPSGQTEFLQLRKMKSTLQWEKGSTREAWKELSGLSSKYTASITGLNDILGKYNRHFGYRVAWEMARFVCLASDQTGSNNSAVLASLDLAIMEKVLPKLHGTQGELEQPLLELFSYCITGPNGSGMTKTLLNPEDWTVSNGILNPVKTKEEVAIIKPKFPRSAKKLWWMLDRLKRQGFTSFID